VIKRNREKGNIGDFKRHGEKLKRMGSREDKGYQEREREKERERE
jgi:hypothetical protein